MVESTPSSNGSRIFLRHRALGYVSNHLPVVSRYIRRRKENLFVTCVGKAFHVYGCNHFKLLSVSPQHDNDITCLAADFFHIYTASNNIIYAWRRGIDIVGVYRGHEAPIHLILPFGPHLVSIDEAAHLKVWDIKAGIIYLELSFGAHFTVSAICHPNTYLNKVLLGSSQGSLQLWNLKSAKRVYTFSGWKSPINVLEQSPAVDVIGIGLTNKKIILHNIKFDETLMEFVQTWGPVTCLSFRTDGPPILVSGSSTGHLTIWNLEEKQVENQIKKAHCKTVAGACFLYNEPLLVSSSPDNTLKLWIFDKPDGNGRLLRMREGHSAPPTFIRFYGTSSENILSAGGDSTLRIFNTRSETSNKNLGIASGNRKNFKKKNRIEKMNKQIILPPISQFSFETVREKDWNNIAAVHFGKQKVSLWSFHKSKMDDMFLVPQRCESIKESKPTCVHLTHCGNFAIIGYSTGHIDKFNIQSGAHRGCYGADNEPAHESGVRGIVSDNLNQIVISGGSDRRVKVWRFKNTGKPPLRNVLVDNGISFFRSHQESSMLAVCLDDYTISIIDIDTCTVIRKFAGHTGQLCDADFSPDSRWLITAAMDCTVRVWDIPSSQLVDCFQVDAPCTSLSFSQNGEYLVTSHVDNIGLFLWANKSLFSHLSLRPIFDINDIPNLELPHSKSNIGEKDDDVIDNDPEEENDIVQIEHLVTLSLASNSRWQNILDIDVIQKRNKPKEVVKPLTNAPFFLPTLSTLDFQFDLSNVQNQNSTSSVNLNKFNNLTAFAQLLARVEGDNYETAITNLKQMGPSAIRQEIILFSPQDNPENGKLMIQYLKLINSMFLSCRDYELAQAYLAIFIKIYTEYLSSNAECVALVQDLKHSQSEAWDRFKYKVMCSLSIIDFMKK